MKKNNYCWLLVLLLLLGKTASAQTPEKVLAKAMYKFSHQMDTINLNSIFTDNMVLMLGKNTSVYKSYNRMVSDSIFKANFKGGQGNNLTAPAKPGGRTEVYLYTDTRKALQTDLLVKKYLYEVNYPEIAWKIKKDTATIAGLKCQKAVGAFAGRVYEAWFAPELPFKAGPWKLCGLPGLIIKASDQKKQVMFECIGFSTYTGPEILIEPSKDCLKTTQAGFHKLNEAFLDNPTAFIMSVMPGVKNIQLPAPYKRRPPANNPIELAQN